jgi:hypothetical protein
MKLWLRIYSPEELLQFTGIQVAAGSHSAAQIEPERLYGFQGLARVARMQPACEKYRYRRGIHNPAALIPIQW